jgi:hypothetical protein
VGGEPTERDAGGNTYKARELKDGTRCLVPKNYFSERELAGLFEDSSATVEDVHYGKNRCHASCRV